MKGNFLFLPRRKKKCKKFTGMNKNTKDHMIENV